MYSIGYEGLDEPEKLYFDEYSCDDIEEPYGLTSAGPFAVGEPEYDYEPSIDDYTNYF